MSVSIWNFKDYKAWIRALSSQSERGFVTRLAQAAGCQPSYLSQSLNSKVQLTPDQACAIALFLQLPENETDFFLTLVDLARAGTKSLKSRLEAKAEALLAKSQNIGERLKRPSWDSPENQAVYYSSWTWAALHIMTSIREFQTADAMAERLKMSRESVLGYLSRLEEMGLVLRDGQSWRHSGNEIHLPKNSPLISLHHNNWRSRAVLKAQEREGVHFSGVYAIAKEDVDRMKEILLRAVQAANELAAPSASEELVAVTCDFFLV